ncbi:hypothetical protein ABT332_13345 [Saccharomonospora azurea]|uniref:hypothetical protein n=1 Tax=Saccharomonospora azurea TaxID=40988 RepID=UPI00332EDB3E
MQLADLIPTTLGQLGAYMAVFAVFLVLVDAPGGVNWSRIAGIFAIIAGYGLGGGIGQWLSNTLNSIVTSVNSAASEAVGAGIGAVLILCLAGWAFFRVHKNGKGAQASKGKGMGKKVRSLALVAILALAGAGLASFQDIHSSVAEFVAMVGGNIHSALS